MTADPTKLKVAKQHDHAGIFFGLARAPGTKRLFAGCSDAKLYAVDLAAEKVEWKELTGHESYVTGVALAGPFVVSGGWDGKLIWWSSDTHELVRKVDAHSKWVRAVSASPNGRVVASVLPSATSQTTTWPTLSAVARSRPSAENVQVKSIDG